MQLIRWAFNLTAGMIAAFVSLYLVIGLCVLAFKLTGCLSEGQIFFDVRTSSYASLIVFHVACVAIISACFDISNSLGRKSDLAFLRGRPKQESAE